jgi:ribonuclease HI
VANQDLWRPLVEEIIDRRAGEIKLTWVKGHSGNPMNELVDRLAVAAARGQRGDHAG